MLHSVQLPKHLWGEALMHAVWLKTQMSTKVLETTTPLQAQSGPIQAPGVGKVGLST